jgi:hypothetical protein
MADTTLDHQDILSRLHDCSLTKVTLLIGLPWACIKRINGNAAGCAMECGILACVQHCRLGMGDGDAFECCTSGLGQPFKVETTPVLPTSASLFKKNLRKSATVLALPRIFLFLKMKQALWKPEKWQVGLGPRVTCCHVFCKAPPPAVINRLNRNQLTSGHDCWRGV